MSGTSEAELWQLMRSLGISSSFLGTFDCSFPGFIRADQKQTAIINTGSRESGGMHWIAMAWEPRGKVLYLFDPLGWKERDLMRYYGFSYKAMVARSALSTPSHCVTLERNTQAVQCTCSGACGLFCVVFLYCFNVCPSAPATVKVLEAMEGTASALRPTDPAKLHWNQKVMYRFLSANSSYFRKHERTLVYNTRLGLIKTHS
ncbi:protease [Psittacine adenovirus 3]|uniref:Protease n=1 Tax=Psittacine adenovirus 3 TaxID=1580497 RepID=A0A5C0PXS7_9ADEN|nr:protease [Psittacine adenovirus 3]